MSNLTVENVYTRQAAKELSKKHFWKLIGMIVLVSAIVLAITAGGVFLLTLTVGNTFSTSVSAYSYSTSAVPPASFWVGYILLMLVETLVSSGLSLGMMSAMLDLCRGEEDVTVGRVFSRMGQCLKAFGLSLWIGLKVLLWMIPGYGIIMLCVFIGVATESSAAISILSFVGVAALFAMVIPAAYRYMLSTYVLADHPEWGIRDCVTMSKELMAGHKWQAFKLIIPVILIMYAILFGVMLVIGLLTAALSSAPGFVAALVGIITTLLPVCLILYFSIRVSLCYCLFYLKRSGWNQSEEEQ